MNIEILINNLIEYYHVKSITELAEKLNTSQSTISGWRARNAIGALTSTVASVDEEALSNIFASKTQTNNLQNSKIVGAGVDNSQGSKHTYNTNVNYNFIPDYILDDLNILFKRAKGNEDNLIDAIDDFIASQKKMYRQGNK